MEKSIAKPRMITANVLTSKGECSGTFQVLGPNVHIAVRGRSGHRMEPVKSGEILIHLGDAWRCYKDLYSPQRAFLHMKRGSGVVGAVNGDIQEFLADINILREYTRWLFDPASCGTAFSQRAEQFMTYVEGSMTPRKLPALRRALHDFTRGTQTHDTLGRRNPAAAAMAIGGAIGRLGDRCNDIQTIMSVMSGRQFQVYRERMRILQIYNSLLQDLGGKTGQENSVFSCFLNTPNAKTRQAMLKKAKQFAGHFASIRAEPFATNARYVESDLSGIVGKAMTGVGTSAFFQEFAKLRQAILWIRILDAIQTKLIMPLSMVLADARRERTALRKAVGGDACDMPVSFAGDQERLSIILNRMNEVIPKIARSADGSLNASPKGNVLAYLEEAKRFAAEEDDWPSALENLELAASCI